MSSKTSNPKPDEEIEPYVLQVIREERLIQILRRIRQQLRTPNTIHRGIKERAEELSLEVKHLPNAAMEMEDALNTLARIAARCIEAIEQYTV